MRSCGKVRYSQRDHRWQYNMARALCMTDDQGYRHTFIILNTYCFSTAKMVTRKRLICRFIHKFPVLFKDTDNVMNDVQCPPRSWKQAFTLFAVFFCKFSKRLLVSAGKSLLICMFKFLHASWVMNTRSFCKKSPQEEVRWRKYGLIIAVAKVHAPHCDYRRYPARKLSLFSQCGTPPSLILN